MCRRSQFSSVKNSAQGNEDVSFFRTCPCLSFPVLFRSVLRVRAALCLCLSVCVRTCVCVCVLGGCFAHNAVCSGIRGDWLTGAAPY